MKFRIGFFSAAVLLVGLLGGADSARACDSSGCVPRPHCNMSWCASPAGLRLPSVAVGGCAPDQAAIRAAIGVLTADGSPPPLSQQAFPLNSVPEGWGVILSYSGLQMSYRVLVHEPGCHVYRVELIPAR